jgi:cell division protein FtsB
LSVVVRTKRKKQRPLSTVAMWLVLGLAVVFFLVRYGQELFLESDLRAKAATQRTVNQALRDENARLKANLQYFQSDKYVEQRAREDLNLRRPDENVLIPITSAQTPKSKDQSPPAPGNPAQSSVLSPQSSTTERPNWLRWFDLFSPGP